MLLELYCASTGFMFLANMQIAISDLLCEGKYAELMQEKPKTV